MRLIKKKIGKFKMWLDPKDKGVGQRLNAIGHREPCFMWMIDHYAEGRAVDVGANIGYCSLHLAQKCQSLIAIEPDKRSRKTLKLNLKENKIKATILKHPVSSKVETVSFYQMEKPNLSSIIPSDRKRFRKDSMTAYPLDELIPLVEDVPLFIKMDIEGGEVGAIQGAKNLLEKTRNVKLLMELHPDKYNKDNDFEQVLRELVETGFKFKLFEHAKGKLICFGDYKIVKNFRGHGRDVLEAKGDEIIEKCCTMDTDGKKFIRSILMEKGYEKDA